MWRCRSNSDLGCVADDSRCAHFVLHPLSNVLEEVSSSLGGDPHLKIQGAEVPYYSVHADYYVEKLQYTAAE